jgi:hypothetical protein
MLKMKITINSPPRRKLYALDVYSGVEVILEVPKLPHNIYFVFPDPTDLWS